MMKRLTALLLALAMLLSVMPGMTLGVFAEGEGAPAPTMPAAPEGHDHTSHDGWTAWDANASADYKTTMPSVPGKYYLTEDVKLTAEWAFTGDVVFDICLCGNDIIQTVSSKRAIRPGFDATLSIYDCTATGTGSSYDAGKITGVSGASAINLRCGATLNLVDGIIADNSQSSTGAGGAVYLGQGSSGDNRDGAVFNMYGGKISGNTAGTHGGAVAVGGRNTSELQPGKFNMSGGEISGNTAGTYGGAISTPNSANICIFGGTISGNTAGTDGGAIGAYANATVNVVDTDVDVVFQSNQADNGGAIYAQNADVMIGNASFDQNKATDGSGGALCLEADDKNNSSAATITAASFTGNTATAGGGAIYVVDSSATMGKVTFDKNKATAGNGGAIYAQKVNADTSVTITEGSFTENEAAVEAVADKSSRAGAIYVNKASVTITTGTFSKNKAVNGDGGAIFATVNAKVQIGTGSFAENKALVNPNYTGGSGRGGAIYATSSETVIQIDNSEFTDNQSDRNGGAIFTNNSGTQVILSNGTMSGNQSPQGGAIYVGTGKVTLKNMTVSGNTSDSYGAIRLPASATLTVSGKTVIAGNTSNGSPRNIYTGYSSSNGGSAATVAVGTEGLAEGSWIGVSGSEDRWTNFPAFTNDLGDKDYTVNFFSDSSDYAVGLQDGKQYMKSSDPHAHCICGKHGCTEHGGEVAFTAWNDPYSLPTSGDYVLMTDVTLDAQYNMGDANLCLNGHTITQTAAGQRIIYVNSNTTVSITDCSAEPGGLTAAPTAGGASLIGVRNTATLNLWNGKLYGNTKDGEGAAVYLNEASGSNKGSTFNMYGGEISGNTGKNGAAVMVNGHNKDSYDANQPYTQFNMYGGKITGNTVSANGGAIYAQREATVNIQGGVIENNTAGGTGGAVYASGSNVTVGGTAQINKNTAVKGGAIYGTASTTITVTGGSFTGNKATTTEDKTGGGAIYTEGVLTASNATFSENISGYMGGAIYAHETATVELTNVKFEKNEAVRGGAISSRFSPVTADGCSFNENKASNNGGAIQGNNAKLILKSTAFTKNDSGSVGGAFYASSNQDMEMTGCTITGNTALNAGAVALYGGQWTITDTTITDNTATNSGAGAVYLRYSSYGVNTTTLAGTTTITGNKEGGSTRNIYMANEDTGKEPYLIIAEGFSGNVGIFMPSSRADVAELAYISSNTVADTTGFYSDNTNYTVTLKNERLYMEWGHSHCICGVAGCTEHEQVRFKPWSDAAKLPEQGDYYLTVDVVLTKQAEIDPDDTLNLCLCGHTVTQTVAGQKHIEVGKGATVSITDCQETVGGFTSTVEANVAAITVARNGGTLNLWNGKIYGNTGKEGAAVSVFQAQGSEKGAVFNMYGGEISGNNATNVAGAVMISGHHETDYDATLPYSAFNMYGGKITGNSAVNDGGAIYAQREAKVNLVGGIIENNTTGGEGGAVFASNSTVTIGEDMQISGNTANNAGAVYASGGTQVTVSGGKITGNTATVNGGALYSTGAKTVITVSGGEISGNKAGNAGGGAIVETKSTFNLTGGTITGNTAAYGGGIYVNNSAKLNMTGGTVSKNTSEKTGGGIYMIGSSTGVLSGGKILENAAGANGGGMYITGNGTTATLNGVTIQKNTATGKGGGVYIYSSAKQLNLSGNTVITSNKAAGKTSNLHLQGVRIMELGTMGEKAKVGITVDGVARVISNTIKTDYSANFTSDLSSRKVVYLNGVLTLQVSSDHQHCLCAAEVTACDHSAVVWEAWTDKTSLPTGGNYYLTVDVQMTKAIEVSEELNLCLNGHTVKAGKDTYHIQVAQGGKLSITDCAKTTGKLTGGNRSGSGGSVRVARGAEFNLYKGKLTGNKATQEGGAVYVWMGTKDGDGGVFNMYGGLIYENSAVNGGGVSIGGASDGAKPGIFNLSGGTIRNNSSTSGGGGIYINDGGQFTMTDGIVKENSSKYGGGIYLNGAKATLSGGYVKANAAKYQVTVKDGKEEKSGGNGGGVYVRGAEATLSGVYIYENTADAAGGGVCTARIIETVNGETVYRGSTVNMTGGKVYKNSATHAGGILVQSMATFTMKDGSVYSNTASSTSGGSGNGGGFYVNNATLNVEGGTVKTNTAVLYGGGIYSENKAQLNISGGEILSNTAKYGAGVAQKQSTAVLSGGTITKNTASGNGGGLYVRAAEANLSGIVITANTAKANGGGICTARVTETVDGVEKEYASTIVMTGGEVSKNKAANGGGMFIQSKAVFTLKDGAISGNTSTKNGGGAYVSTDSVLNMEGGKIDGNKGVYGAGIYNYRGTANLSGGAVSSNEASKNGGGVYASGSEVNLTGVTVSGNSAKTNGGGVTTAKATVTTNGVKKEHYSTITMTGGSISGNTAKSNAGGILIQSKAVFKLSGGSVTGNTATSNGGGIFVSTDSSLQMTGGTVSKNHSERYGGGIYMMRSENTIRNALISGNTAVKNGGGLYVTGAKLDIQNSRIVKNVAEASGGALCTSKTTSATDKGYKDYFYPTLSMSGCTVEENQAKTGGGIVLQSYVKADISDTTFTGNAATNSAGALYIASGEMTFTDLVFKNNTAGKQGGAVYAGSNESNSTFTNCTFTDNTAETDGGAIYYRSNAEFIECTVTGNKAGASGGGIGTGKNANRSNFQDGVRIYDSKISGNTAGTQGGGLYLSLGMITQVHNTEITNNVAAAEGGAIWAVDDLTMIGLKATGNTSGGNGYAVWLDAANYDGHSYFTGRMKVGGNTQITDNDGGDLYMGKEVVITMTGEGLGQDAKINVTLDSGLLTNRVYGAYNYSGGNCVYTITYGDRSLTEPEYAEPVSEETEPTEGTEGTTAATEPKAENTLLYAGVGAFAVVIAAIAVIVVLLNRKKKKAEKTATEVSQD